MPHYHIAVLLTGGDKIHSPAFDERADAEAELEELRREMLSNSPTQRSWFAVSNALQSIKAASVVEEPGDR